ncbi:MAG: carboxypeptidase-like regulatory domain-containing protein [Myxococcota bacterium]
MRPVQLPPLAAMLACAVACFPDIEDKSEPDETTSTEDTGNVAPLDCASVEFFGQQPDFANAGTLVGNVASPSGAVPVAGAKVTVLVDGEEAWSASLEQGCFHLDLPPGTHAIAVEKGRYGGSAEVEIEAGETVDVGTIRLDDGGVRVAVVFGEWDDAGQLVDDLGLPADGYLSPHELLADADLLAEYDVVFANCGSEASRNEADGYTADEIANTKAWVEAGGTLYVSDWEYELFEGVAPDAASFEADPHSGPSGVVTGTLLDRDLVALLGKETVDVRYDLPRWVVPRDVGPDGEPLVEGSVAGADRPLALVTHPGAGRAAFTTFHNEEQLSDDILAVLYQMILLL